MKLPNGLKFLVFIITFFSMQVFAAEAVISDSAITGNVKAKIMADKLVKNAKVEVHTNNQIVTFVGEVNSNSEASTLVELAQSTPDVKDVDTDKLTVKGSDQPLSDTYITAKIKGKYLREKLFGEKDISIWTIKVETKNGTVYLIGEADNKKQAENAVRLAQHISGVKQVKYRIKTIKGDKINYDYTNY